MFTKSQPDAMATPLGRLLPRSLVRDRTVYIQIPPGRSTATCGPLHHLMRCYDYLGVHSIERGADFRDRRISGGVCIRRGAAAKELAELRRHQRFILRRAAALAI